MCYSVVLKFYPFQQGLNFFLLQLPPRIRPSFRDGPRSPTNRRPTRERRLDSVEEEDVDLAVEEKMYEEKMATLKSRKYGFAKMLFLMMHQKVLRSILS